jgi:hypothetical protein
VRRVRRNDWQTALNNRRRCRCSDDC